MDPKGDECVRLGETPEYADLWAWRGDAYLPNLWRRLGQAFQEVWPTVFISKDMFAQCPKRQRCLDLGIDAEELNGLIWIVQSSSQLFRDKHFTP